MGHVCVCVLCAVGAADDDERRTGTTINININDNVVLGILLTTGTGRTAVASLTHRGDSNEARTTQGSEAGEGERTCAGWKDRYLSQPISNQPSHRTLTELLSVVRL